MTNWPIRVWEASEWIGGNGASRPLQEGDGRPRVVFGPCLRREYLDAGVWLEMVGGRDHLMDVVGPEDVVYIPLLASCINEPAWDWEHDKCADYDVHLEVIRELAPRVEGILLGNMGPEFAAHVGAAAAFRGRQAVDIVKRGAEIVRDAGGSPWFGTVDWTLVMDCYGGQMVRDAMIDTGSTQVSFCGYCLHPGGWWDKEHPLYGGQVRYQERRSGTAPSTELQNYLRSSPVWTDVNGPTGLNAGNAELLEAMGFVGGVLDPLMP